MITKTHIAKAIEASRGQSTKQLRGFFDQASKNVVADRQILARIVSVCVWEARRFSVGQIQELLPGDIYVSGPPVFRDDDAAEDPGAVRQDNGTSTEGVVRFDIMFRLELPGDKEPILLVINVEIQNTDATAYPLESRGVDYACRLVGRQGPDYANIRKVYSIWIVTNSKDTDKENTVETFAIANRVSDEVFEAAPKAAQLFEVCFLYLGEHGAAGASQLLRMLDILFSTSFDVQEKKDMLEREFDVRMSKEVTYDMGVMVDMELAIESRARQEGEVTGKLGAYLETRQPRSFILQKLEAHFGSRQKAQTFFEEYVTAHPGEAAHLNNPAGDLAEN